MSNNEFDIGVVGGGAAGLTIVSGAAQLGAKVVFGHARFIDEHRVNLDGKMISADKWVIATGYSPVVPSIKGLAETPHLTNKEIFYMDNLPASMIILGAGPIGIEMAQAFNRLGTKVTVIDRSAQILGKEDFR